MLAATAAQQLRQMEPVAAVALLRLVAIEYRVLAEPAVLGFIQT
jgi:hypothetical protein